MSIKKSLLALAMMGLALMGFASSAMAATDGVVRDFKDNSLLPANREFHFIGWAKFETARGGFECHVTSVSKSKTPSTGEVTKFEVPDTTKCTGSGFLAGCKLQAGHGPLNTPYHVTTTPTDFDVKGKEEKGEVAVNSPLEGFLCPDLVVEFPEITLRPLKTGTDVVTGTNTHLKKATTANAGEEIAGVEISGVGKSTGGPFGEEVATATGELELTDADRCTWKLASS